MTQANGQLLARHLARRAIHAPTCLLASRCFSLSAANGICRALAVRGYARRRIAGNARAFSAATSRGAASVLVRGEIEAAVAARRAAEALEERLGEGCPPHLTLWFAKGYGHRAGPIGALLQERFGRHDGVVIGSSAEGGVLADGAEVQNETFALAALALRLPSTRLVPFHAEDLAAPTALADQREGAEAPQCVLGFAALPLPPGANPQAWCSALDAAAGGTTTVVGGLTIGHHVFVGGSHHQAGGAFGVVLAPERGGPTFDAVVCQGAVPFGPRVEITGVQGDHVVTEVDGKNPRQVLEPLLHGPKVPANGTTMAGIFVDDDATTPASTLGLSTSSRSFVGPSARPNCLVRPLHAWTPEGHLVLSPVTDDTPYAPGMHFQLHCMNRELALEDLRMQAGYDVMANDGRPPDAAVIVPCGARGVQLYETEGVESDALREVWGGDVPSVGFFAGGEFGPAGRRTYVHGFTTTCLMVRYPRA